MTEEQRQQTLLDRHLKGRPIHSPRHHQEKGVYLITGACFEHQTHIGKTDQRMDDFSAELLDVFRKCEAIDAWVVLPNHYHVLVSVKILDPVLKEISHLHGRTAFRWNGEDEARGRKVWFNFLDRKIESDAHHIEAMHYVFHNPVKHGYVKKWDEWKWSSAAEYIQRLGRDEVARRWKEYPFLKFGDGWDD